MKPGLPRKGTSLDHPNNSNRPTRGHRVTGRIRRGRIPEMSGEYLATLLRSPLFA